MTTYDLTVAVTAHSETVVAGPPMRSAENAIRAAENAGFSVERIIALDSPTEMCRAFFRQAVFGMWKTLEFSLSNPGRVRNSVIEQATGRWIAFLDADDLYSENWLAVAARRLAEADAVGSRLIVHPEVNWVFDGSEFVLIAPSQDDRLFTPFYFYFFNYYDTLCMAPRKAHLEYPYPIVDIPAGFGSEDKQWNIETMAGGWKHVVAPDTIIFKRRRDASVYVQYVTRRTTIYDIEAMAIDQISNLNRIHETSST